ncbi:MAG: acyl-CoA dehydrogenase family protein [Magnetospirillum sp.]
MDFNFTEEQLALKDTLRRFVRKEYSFEHRRQAMASRHGFDRDAWNTFAELGLLGLPLQESLGGLGGTAVDSMVVMEILGEALSLEPFLSSSLLCGSVLNAVPVTATLQELAAQMMTGRHIMALAHYEPGSRYDLAQVSTTATATAGDWVISGSKSVVLGAPNADTVIVSARTPGGVSLFLVDSRAPGLAMRPYATQDGLRAADLILERVTVPRQSLLAPEGDGLKLVEQALDTATAALCAEAVGIMDRLNQTTVEYLKTRKQFGTMIGKFQALQHRMAEMVVATEQARSMAIMAAIKVSSTERAERAAAISAAKAYVGNQARFVGQQAVQLHGGIGVTDELDVAHYFKRLTMIGHTFGDYDHHIARFAEAL